MFGDMGKIMGMLGKFKDIKAGLPKMKEELTNARYTETVAGGKVTATVNGKMQLIDLKIGEIANYDDSEMLEDLIKAAVNAAQSTAADAAAKAMQELTGGMDLNGMEDLL